MRRILAVVALGLLTACGGSEPLPLATDDPAPSASPTKRKPRPTASRSATPTPTPTATTPPPVTGRPVGTEEALVRLAEPGETRPGEDCAKAAPDVSSPRCSAVETAGGTLIAVTGWVEGRKLVRLLVPVPEGYVTRYEGFDDGRSWASTRVYAAPLAGHGTDGVVVFVRLTDGAATYDVLTWIEGGPLVLRAHRGPLADGRLAPRDGALDEYALATDGAFVRRRLAWDGRRFLISAGQRTTTPPPR